MEVTVGKESLVFESGPFSHFGSCALTAGGVFALGDELGEHTIEKIFDFIGAGRSWLILYIIIK